jgi:hypothetical protein
VYGVRLLLDMSRKVRIYGAVNLEKKKFKHDISKGRLNFIRYIRMKKSTIWGQTKFQLATYRAIDT